MYIWKVWKIGNVWNCCYVRAKTKEEAIKKGKELDNSYNYAIIEEEF